MSIEQAGAGLGHARTMLPIPDRPAPGLTTYDAKSPDTAVGTFRAERGARPAPRVIRRG